MFNSFLSLPTILMCLIAIIIAAGISIVALVIIRKKLGWESFKENHEVGGFLFNALGLIYAVLIAFVVYASWEDYNSAGEVCDKEANSLQDLFLNSEGLPLEYQSVIREKILEYLNEVIRGDWPLLENGEPNPKSKQSLVELWKIFMNIDNLSNEKQGIVYGVSLGILNDITDNRRLRILSSQNHIPVVIWTVISIGALTSIGFSLFFGTRSLAVQAAMTSLFALTNAIIFLLILNLDHPFIGDIKITSEPYEFVLMNLQSYKPK